MIPSLGNLNRSEIQVGGNASKLKWKAGHNKIDGSTTWEQLNERTTAISRLKRPNCERNRSKETTAPDEVRSPVEVAFGITAGQQD